MNQPTLKTNRHYLLILLAQAKTMGLDQHQLLQEIGYSSDAIDDKEVWVDNDLLAALIKKLWQNSNDELLGISPEPVQTGTWALACDYMIAAETLGDLYRRGQRICQFIKPGTLGIAITTDTHNANIEVQGYIGEQDPNHFLMEFLCVTWHRFACWAINEYIPLNQAFFSYTKPQHAHFYEEIFQCNISFSQPRCGYSFHKKHLQKTVCRNRQELQAWLKNSPADLMYMPGRDNSITHYIKQALENQLIHNQLIPNFDDTCHQLNISPQVARKRLEEEGSSFQKIKDTVRQERIKDLLSNSDHSISDITALAGFTESASLTRAFKKWTGMTPAQYRNQQRG
ncbi:MAG: AraC family transcriptional regulator [Candidatus Pelagadaptatus aseana]|uniref:AraC family transcriptional regulator n=1 Tax=Candidatus Pelagadaptatus aseana TaxID=3120508 RepID=UPI0039B2AB80